VTTVKEMVIYTICEAIHSLICMLKNHPAFNIWD